VTYDTSTFEGTGHVMSSPSGDVRTVCVAFHEPVIGGAAIAILRILPLLEQRGWRFSFWVPRPGALADELSGRGYEVAGEERLLRYSRAALSVPPGAVARLASVPGYLRRFRGWMKDRDPALLHANTLITIPEALAGRTTGVPVLLYVHEILGADARGAVAARLMRACADGVVTNSETSVAALLARNVPARMIHYGIEVPPAPEPPSADPPFVVGTLGTVSPRKGSDVFLAAARIVRRELPEAEFRMIGPCPDGSERAWAEERVAEARADGVIWGTTSDVFSELAGWDLLVLPSRSEPFGLVLIEAMAMRRPVVASNVDGPAEIVTPETGVLVAADDSEGLAAAIVELARDRPRRLSMGDAGRARVEQVFSLEHQASRVHHAYLDAIARRASASH
jgi:glycosyltransferase involved in cell wall biosynthesis